MPAQELNVIGEDVGGLVYDRLFYGAHVRNKTPLGQVPADRVE
jgi:hypothetical protein